MDATDRGSRAPGLLLLDQLPSYQSLLYRRKSSSWRRSSVRGSGRSRQPSVSSGKWMEQKGGLGEEELRPIRELPVSLREKREERAQRLQLGAALSPLSLWRQNLRRSLRRMKEETLEVLSSLQLWRAEIHLIQGMFGTGILSYFSFLRFLVLLNISMFLLMFLFVMLPVIICTHSSHSSPNSSYGVSNESECRVYPDTSRHGLVVFHEHITDLLSGTGFLERTYLFYGFYSPALVHWSFYHLPLAYLLCTIAYLLLSLLWIVKRAAAGFKRNLVQDVDRFQSFCNKVFAGWDFCISDANAARLKHSSLLYELKTDLEEERIKRKMAGRSRREKCRIYFLRAALNLFVVSVLVACFYCIYRATVFSQRKQAEDEKSVFVLELVVEYLPSIVITLANFITPLIFSLIITFEDYSPAFEIRFTLMRCVFMRLASIGVLLFSLWVQIADCRRAEDCRCGFNHQAYPCWETHVGQEMYKLLIFDFLIVVSVTIFVEFPRKLIVTHCGCGLAHWWGQQEFSVPQNVLEMVYGQTICWIGTFYSPALPALNTLKYLLLFQIKKASLVQNCRPASRPFRSSSSHFFFLVVLLIGLALACVPVLVSILQIRASAACGPFMDYSWASEALDQMNPKLLSVLRVLNTETSAVCVFLISCLAMFYIMALAGAHKRVIEQLREQLALEGRDKRFLIQKLCQAQRRVGAAAASPRRMNAPGERCYLEASREQETQA